MTSPDNWGRISLNNEIVTLHEVKSDGRFSWIGRGRIDGEKMVVTLYREHKKAIIDAGYTDEDEWDRPQIIFGEPATILLVEDNGRRRIAAVKIIDTEDEWIEVKQKGQIK